MNRSRFLMFTCLLLLGAAVFLGSSDLFAQAMKQQAETDTTTPAGNGVTVTAPGSPFDPSDPRASGKMRATTPAQRKAARLRQAPPKTGVSKEFAGLNPATAAMSPLAIRAGALATMSSPFSQPDYFGVANWANSPLPLSAGINATAAAATIGSVTDAFGNTTYGIVTAITGGLGGTGYMYPYVTIAAPPSPCWVATCRQAVATATAVGGAITAITIVDGGAGYVSDALGTPAPPAVNVFGVAPGTGMRKFVDTLPGLCALGSNNLGQCIPLATPEASSPFGPNEDFYRLRLEGYYQQMHSDLPGPCTTDALGVTTCVASPPAPPGTRLWGYAQFGGSTTPHQYLGPLILARKDRPVRILFQNSLTEDSFIPVDTTYMGAGPVSDATHTNVMASLKRSDIHLHGGNTPWISDGTPHQWITPAGGDGQPNALGFAKGMSFQNVPGMMTALGLAASLTDGYGTYYWTNQQSGRFMFYHEHAYGITRTNVYAGVAGGYLLVDPVQETALRAATVPGTITNPGTPTDLSNNDLTHLVPLVIQDKTFVPDNGALGGQLAATDPTWPLSAAVPGNLWFPHVYMPNQNPSSADATNPFGRWDYGPWFWPPQNPATYVPQGQPYPCQSVAYPGVWLTCPGTPNPSGTPEGFMDTMVVNGTAYPKLPVEPRAYRFQILSAGNDRALNLGLYYAVDRVTGKVCDAAINPGLFTAANCTEVSMVAAVQHTNPSTTADTLVPCSVPVDVSPGGMLARADMTTYPATGLPPNCWPSSWPTDGRDGGVPDPRTAGPAIIQIGTEGGLLPKPAAIPSTPMNYEYNRRSITVLNVFTHGLVLGPAERADAIVDFSTVTSGSVLILYNDAPAPVPAFDPRVDYYTGAPDQTDTGGAPSTIAGLGPNTRTVMQIQVNGTQNLSFTYATLAAALPVIFAGTQDKIIVPEPDYPAGNGGTNGLGTYARIADTSIAPWTGGAVGNVALAPPNLGGSGYITPPAVIIADPAGCVPSPTCLTATANTVLGPGSVRLVTLNTTPSGSGYTSPPTVGFTGGGGTGALATAVLTPTRVASVAVTNGGSGYVAPCTVSFTGGGATTNATATATVQTTGQKKITGITLTGPVVGGAGYTGLPTVNVTCTAGSGAVLTPTLAPTSVASVIVTFGGSNYTSAPAVKFTGGGGTGAAATATLARPVASIALAAPNFGGAGYTATPIVTIAKPPVGKTATAVATAPAQPLLRKAIHELFTLDYGRMNAVLGVENPLTDFFTQTTIPYGYVDPPTEIFRDGETQYWKITHNGVDTHWIHFHLFNVQVINRVGWDGTVKPPDDNELSWKDTVRMNPLEDIIVALRPLSQTGLPFASPHSIRPLDVTQPVGVSLPNQFANVDPTNQPATVTNDLTNFGWEYVWHCHILGHEENDMMRAMVFAAAPEVPTLQTVALNSGNGQVTVTWKNNAITQQGFTIQRAPATAGVPSGSFTTVGTAKATDTAFIDKPPVPASGTYAYQVIANGGVTVGYTKKFQAPAVGWPTTTTSNSAPSNVVAIP